MTEQKDELCAHANVDWSKAQIAAGAMMRAEIAPCLDCGRMVCRDNDAEILSGRFAIYEVTPAEPQKCYGPEPHKTECYPAEREEGLEFDIDAVAGEIYDAMVENARTFTNERGCRRPERQVIADTLLAAWERARKAVEGTMADEVTRPKCGYDSWGPCAAWAAGGNPCGKLASDPSHRYHPYITRAAYNAQRTRAGLPVVKFEGGSSR